MKLSSSVLTSIYDVQELEKLDWNNPIFTGENLRNRFFTDDGYGCYRNFDVRDDVVKLESTPVTYNDGFVDESHVWTRYVLDEIVMEYYWDGDGVLQFIFSDGTILVNNDCKKSSTWEWDFSGVG